MKKTIIALAFAMVFSACSTPSEEASWEECCALDTEVLLEFVQFNQAMATASIENQDEILKTGWSELADLFEKMKRHTNQDVLISPENTKIKEAFDQLEQILDADYRMSRWPLDIGQEGFDQEHQEMVEYLKEIEEILVK